MKSMSKEINQDQLLKKIKITEKVVIRLFYFFLGIMIGVIISFIYL